MLIIFLRGVLKVKEYKKEIELELEIFKLKEQMEEARKGMKFLSKENIKEAFDKCKLLLYLCWGIFAVVFNKDLYYSLIGMLIYPVTYTAIGLINRAYYKNRLSSLEERLDVLEKKLKSYQMTKAMQNAYDVQYTEVKNPHEKIAELKNYKEVLLSIQEEDVVGVEIEEELEGKTHNYRPKNRL